MKTPPIVIAVLISTGFSLAAQNITLTGGLLYAAPAQAVQATPANHTSAPVVYQAAPAYTALPVAVVPVAVASPVVYAPAVSSPVVNFCGRSPDVIYFGGPYSHLRNYYSAYHPRSYRGCSTVVYFGRGERFERGYPFGRCR